MRVFKTKTFDRCAKKSNVSDEALIASAIEISQGNFEANLGSNIFKKRIATKGRGKSGSVRTIVAFKINGHSFFMFGYEKNDKSSLTENEERALRLVAKGMFEKTEAELNKLVKNGALVEVRYE